MLGKGWANEVSMSEHPVVAIGALGFDLKLAGDLKRLDHSQLDRRLSRVLWVGDSDTRRAEHAAVFAKVRSEAFASASMVVANTTATTVLRAGAKGAIDPSPARQARTAAVDALTTIAALVGACFNAAVIGQEADKAFALSLWLLADPVRRAIVRANADGAVRPGETVAALAFAVGQAFAVEAAMIGTELV